MKGYKKLEQTTKEIQENKKLEELQGQVKETVSCYADPWKKDPILQRKLLILKGIVFSTIAGVVFTCTFKDNQKRLQTVSNSESSQNISTKK